MATVKLTQIRSYCCLYWLYVPKEVVEMLLLAISKRWMRMGSVQITLLWGKGRTGCALWILSWNCHNCTLWRFLISLERVEPLCGMGRACCSVLMFYSTNVSTSDVGPAPSRCWISLTKELCACERRAHCGCLHIRKMISQLFCLCAFW